MTDTLTDERKALMALHEEGDVLHSLKSWKGIPAGVLADIVAAGNKLQFAIAKQQAYCEEMEKR